MIHNSPPMLCFRVSDPSLPASVASICSPELWSRHRDPSLYLLLAFPRVLVRLNTLERPLHIKVPFRLRGPFQRKQQRRDLLEPTLLSPVFGAPCQVPQRPQRRSACFLLLCENLEFWNTKDLKWDTWITCRLSVSHKDFFTEVF